MNPKASKILVVDDNQAVHEDYRKVLETPQDDELLDQMESALFGGDSSAQPTLCCGFYRYANATGLERNQNGKRDLENRCQLTNRNLHRLHRPYLG